MPNTSSQGLSPQELQDYLSQNQETQQQPPASQMGQFLGQSQSQPQPQTQAQQPTVVQPWQQAAPAQQQAADQPPKGYTLIGDYYHRNYVDPGKFVTSERILKDRNIEHRVFQYKTPEDAAKGAGGEWTTAYQHPVTGQWYSDVVGQDADGNPTNIIDPRLVGRGKNAPVDAKTHQSRRSEREIVDPDAVGHHSTAIYDPTEGKYSRPSGDNSPLPAQISRYYSNSDYEMWQLKHQVTQAAANIKSMGEIDLKERAALNAIDKEEAATRLDPLKAAMASANPGMFDEQRANARSVHDDLRRTWTDRMQNLPSIQNFIKNPPVGARSIGGSAEAVGNPLGESEDGKFKTFFNPDGTPNHKLGMQSNFDLIKRYQSPRGVWNVNGDNTLQEMISQWAPVNDPRGKNNPTQYTAEVAKTLGVSVNTPIKQIDSAALAKAMLPRELGPGNKNIPTYSKYVDEIASGNREPDPSTLAADGQASANARPTTPPPPGTGAPTQIKGVRNFIQSIQKAQ